MNESNHAPLIALMAFCLCGGMLFGGMIKSIVKDNEWQKAVVAHGFAEYHVAPDGSAEWVWKEAQ